MNISLFLKNYNKENENATLLEYHQGVCNRYDFLKRKYEIGKQKRTKKLEDLLRRYVSIDNAMKQFTDSTYLVVAFRELKKINKKVKSLQLKLSFMNVQQEYDEYLASVFDLIIEASHIPIEDSYYMRKLTKRYLSHFITLKDDRSEIAGHEYRNGKLKCHICKSRTLNAISSTIAICQNCMTAIENNYNIYEIINTTRDNPGAKLANYKKLDYSRDKIKRLEMKKTPKVPEEVITSLTDRLNEDGM
jgi:ribosomal protein L37AE/L43A